MRFDNRPPTTPPGRLATVGLLIAISTVAAGAGGCVTVGKPTGYLSDYEQLRPGKFLKGVHLEARAAAKAKGGPVVIAAIDTSRVKRKPEEVEAARKALRSAIEKLVARLGLADVIRFGGSGRIRVELAITEADPGSPLGRYLAGAFGAGHAFAQVEGRVLDGRAGQQLGAFSERRRASGHIGFRDLGDSEAGPKMVTELLEEIAESIVKELAASILGKADLS